MITCLIEKVDRMEKVFKALRDKRRLEIFRYIIWAKKIYWLDLKKIFKEAEFHDIAQLKNVGLIMLEENTILINPMLNKHFLDIIKNEGIGYE